MRFQPSLASIRVATTFAVLLLIGASQSRAGIDPSIYDSSATYHNRFNELIENRAHSQSLNTFDALSASVSLGSSFNHSSVSAWAQGGVIGPGAGLELKTFAIAAADSVYNWTLDLGTYDYSGAQFLGQATAQLYDYTGSPQKTENKAR